MIKDFNPLEAEIQKGILVKQQEFKVEEDESGLIRPDYDHVSEGGHMAVEIQDRKFMYSNVGEILKISENAKAQMKELNHSYEVGDTIMVHPSSIAERNHYFPVIKPKAKHEGYILVEPMFVLAKK